MPNFLITWVITAVSLMITAYVVHGFHVRNIMGALIAAVMVGLVNAFVRPILGILAFPITLLTFGLFAFVLNAISILIASKITPHYGLTIDGFIPALLGSIVLTIVSSVITYFVRSTD